MTDTGHGVMADGGIDIDAIREAADYWIRSTYTEAGRAIHVPSDESTRDEPETPCRHTPHAGSWRPVSPDHFDDDLLEERLCGECVANALGEQYQPGGGDVDYSRTPLDRLAEAGLLDEDDDRLRADGGTVDLISEIDDVCATLETILEDVEHPEVEAAIRSAVGHAWQASVLQRVDENTDVRMISSSGSGGVAVHGPDPAEFEREVSDK